MQNLLSSIALTPFDHVLLDMAAAELQLDQTARTLRPEMLLAVGFLSCSSVPYVTWSPMRSRLMTSSSDNISCVFYLTVQQHDDKDYLSSLMPIVPEERYLEIYSADGVVARSPSPMDRLNYTISSSTMQLRRLSMALSDVGSSCYEVVDLATAERARVDASSCTSEVHSETDTDAGPSKSTSTQSVEPIRVVDPSRQGDFLPRSFSRSLRRNPSKLGRVQMTMSPNSIPVTTPSPRPVIRRLPMPAAPSSLIVDGNTPPRADRSGGEPDASSTPRAVRLRSHSPEPYVGRISRRSSWTPSLQQSIDEDCEQGPEVGQTDSFSLHSVVSNCEHPA